MYVFRITPKRVKRSNGTVLTPDMDITVTVFSSSVRPSPLFSAI